MRRAVWAILQKELRELWRDPLSLSLALVLPFVVLLIFTYGLNLDTLPVRLGVLDLDRSHASRDYLASMTASGDLSIAATTIEAADLGAWLDRGTIDVGLILPPDFERGLLSGRSAEVQLLVDGSKPPQAKAQLAQIDAATASYNRRLLVAADTAAAHVGPAVVPEPRVWFNRDLKSINFIVPGLFSLILITFAPLLSTLAIAREREHGSIQQILVAPVSPAAFILGKAIPYGLLAFVQMLIVLAAGLLWFRVPFQGNMAFFLIASVIYVFCAVALGLLISTVTRSQVVAMLLALVATLMPSFLFSGFIFPIYSMTERYQVLSYGFPARYFTEVARGIALKGAGPDQLWPQLAALLGLTGLILLVAIGRFHRRMG